MHHAPFEFPPALDKALRAAARTHGLKLCADTHYDAVNRELRWFDGAEYRRLDFDYDGNTVRVTHYVETFPCLPRLFHLLRHTFIAARLRRTKWDEFGILTDRQDEAFYRQEIGRLLGRTAIRV